MATLPDGLTQAEVEEYLKLDLIIKKASERHKVLGEKIKQAHENAKKGSYIYDTVVVSLQDTTKFDDTSFAADHPRSQHKHLYVWTLDTKALTADAKKAYMVPSTRRLGVAKAN